MPINRKYGWKKDKADSRDFKFIPESDIVLPPVVDLRPAMPPIYDQQSLGSCTSNAIAGLLQFTMIKEHWKATPLVKNHIFTPSRLFIYYNERNMEGTISEDAGAEIRDGIKSVTSIGVCEEDIWPYDITKFTNTPSQECYNQATQHTGFVYRSITQGNDFKKCLAAGWPFTVGFVVYDSFESDQMAATGVGSMPQTGENVLGGHAVVCVGYNDNDGTFILRNSWNTDWGQKGYFTFPQAYLLDPNLSSDFWTVRGIH